MMGRDLAANLGLLWAHRALVGASLGCRMTFQRLCVLLLALVQLRIERSDVQAMAGELDDVMKDGRLRRLERRKHAYGQLRRMCKLGLLSRCEEPGFYALHARARYALERALALERSPGSEPTALEDPDVGYSVYVQEFPGMPSDRGRLTRPSGL